MRAAFDDSAERYDETFTHTSIGKLQRNKVWEYLEKTFGAAFPKNILELNCGTGEDAVFFAKHGANVLATDISEQMLALAKRKAGDQGLTDKIITQLLDARALTAGTIDGKYDLLFSDFGGLNCISPVQLQQLLVNAKDILSPGGRIVLVIMPRFCAWETLYFVSKLEFKKAFRRQARKAQQASLGKNEVAVWYHSPAAIKRLASRYYNIKNIQPVGISIPPSYLQKTFLTKARILGKLDYLENKLNRYRFFSGIADHYLIDLELK